MTSRPETLVLVLWLLLFNGVFSGPISQPSQGHTPQQRETENSQFPSLLDATVDSLTEGLNAQKFTSVDLVKAYFARIAEVNGYLNAVSELNPDALAIAAQLDAERSAGVIRGPLHGIPIIVKYNIATFDKMNTTAGSYALLGAKVPRDSTVVQKLRAAGAILLGKANLSEWAFQRSLNTSNGWSAIGGQAYGPYYPLEDPNGSSSGSGVVSALGLALGALGTETDGSIVSPSSLNNVVGIKPTVGLTSRHLVIPISEHQDTIGPITRTVRDAAWILQAIAGPDPYDNYTSTIPGPLPDYVAACNPLALAGARLGVPRNVIELLSDNTTGPITDAFEKALGVLQAAGATIVDNSNFTAAEEFKKSTLPFRVLNADFIVNLKTYLDLLTYNPNNITSLDALRTFTQSFPAEEYPLRDTGIWDEALASWNNTDPRFWPAYQQNMYYGGEGGQLGAIERDRLDAVILPTKFGHDWAAVTGTPIVTVPLGFYPTDSPVVRNSWGLVESGPNIPFGISFLGAKFTESRLIGLAYAFEQKTMVRNQVQPVISANIDLAQIVGK